MSFLLNGTDEYAGNSTGNPAATLPATISVWFRAASNPGDEAILVGFHDDNTDDAGLCRILMNSSGHLRGQYRGTSGGDVAVDYATDLADDAWHNAVMTIDASGNIELFTDGTSRGTAGPPTNVLNSRNNIAVGASNRGGFVEKYFPGKLAEVAVWPEELSGANITSLQTLKANAIGNNPDGYWDFATDESPISDLIGSADLTLINAPTFDADHPTLGSGGGGGGDGTDLPRYHFDVKPRYPNTRAEMARRETGAFFIDAPSIALLPAYAMGAAPIRLRDQGYAARALTLPTPPVIAPEIPVLPSHTYAALLPRYPNPANLIAQQTHGWKFVDATVPAPPAGVSGIEPLIVTKRWRRRMMRRNPLFWSS